MFRCLRHVSLRLYMCRHKNDKTKHSSFYSKKLIRCNWYAKIKKIILLSFRKSKAMLLVIHVLEQIFDFIRLIFESFFLHQLFFGKIAKKKTSKRLRNTRRYRKELYRSWTNIIYKVPLIHLIKNVRHILNKAIKYCK